MSESSDAPVAPAVGTGLPGLDRVLGGLEPGDNVVWSIQDIDHYRELVAAYERAAARAGVARVYFRFGTHEPLLATDSSGVRIVPLDAAPGFEGFVRAVHEVIGEVGPGAAYIFDSLSDLAQAWCSDRALANFFQLTCPRLLHLRTFTYFGILRDTHSRAALEPIRETTQFLLDYFSIDRRRFIRPLKTPDRAGGRMHTLHMENGDRFEPVTESAVLAEIMARTRGPRLNSDPAPGYWNRLTREIEHALQRKSEGALPPDEETALLRKIGRYFRVHRSGIEAIVRRYLGVEDFHEIRKRQIGAGSIGGKALGMLVARAIVRRDAPELAALMEVHDSFFVGAEIFVTYLVQNDVWWIRENQQCPDRLMEGIEEGRRRILEGRFSADTIRQFEHMLDYFGEAPIIVRSSSILEDARGNAFSGKYESHFLCNDGSRAERLAALLDAIRRVYASIFNPETLLYRKTRGLLASEERMALLIMRVSGRRRGDRFFPQAAGVGLSHNPYRWHPDIDPSAGVVRLVFGLGTRAVDRADDDYTRLVALNCPMRRTETSIDEQLDHSQRRVDVLDLTPSDAVVDSVDIAELVGDCGDLPLDMFVETGEGGVPWVTFRGLIERSDVFERLRAMLAVLERAYGEPVDTEFTLNFMPDGSFRIHLLQCRTFQIRKAAGVIGTGEQENPADVPGHRIIVARGAVIGLGCVERMHDLLYVPASLYADLSQSDRHAVAKLIETLVQKHDPQRRLLLIGPGRWGTSSPSLGIPIRAGRIALASAVCEVVAMHERLVPDVSLGTHFFNDLVEHDLSYFACFAGRGDNTIEEEWLMRQASATTSLLGKAHRLADVVRWIDVSGRRIVLHADPFHQVAVLREESERSTDA
jgi:hypothetical protein